MLTQGEGNHTKTQVTYPTKCEKDDRSVLS